MKEEFIQAVGFDLQTAVKQTIELMGLVNTGYLKNYVYVSFNGNVINIHFPDYAQVLEFGCFFDDNVRILTNKGYKRLKNINHKDLVWNGTRYTKVKQKQVYESFNPIKKVTIYTNNKKLEVTENHPFLTQRGWVEAGKLKKTDKLISK